MDARTPSPRDEAIFGLNGEQRRLLAHLSTQEARSTDELVKVSGLSKRAVVRVCNVLREVGLVQSKSRHNPETLTPLPTVHVATYTDAGLRIADVVLAGVLKAGSDRVGVSAMERQARYREHMKDDSWREPRPLTAERAQAFTRRGFHVDESRVV